jgi:hypothetical protein
MAIIIGESGAWKEVKLSLARWDLHVQGPSELQTLLENIGSEYQPLSDKKKLAIAKSIVENDEKIEQLKSERNLVKRLYNILQINKLNNNIIKLNINERNYIRFLEGRITTLHDLLNSPELSGSEAELNVIRILNKLSDDYIILNNVHLHAHRYYYFDNNYLLSAQIDHIVLSPFGIFVIETKRWSNKFVESGEYHNPYDQVKRASYLCYKLLNQEFENIKVRSVIASEGKLPSIEENKFIKVLRVNELLGYITKYKTIELEAAKVSHIQEYLCMNIG